MPAPPPASPPARCATPCASPTARPPHTTAIALPAGTFPLTLIGAGEDNAATGDLDIAGNTAITGTGGGTTKVDGNVTDRVFDVLSGSALTLNGLTVQGGVAPTGDGVRNAGGLATTDAAIAASTADGAGASEAAAGSRAPARGRPMCLRGGSNGWGSPIGRQ